MNRQWILTFSDVKLCLIQSFRYPVLSLNTTLASLFTVLIFIVCWLTLAGVDGSARDLALISLAGFFFMMVVIGFGWSVNMREYFRFAAIIVFALFIIDIILLNVAGDGMPYVITSALPGTNHNADINLKLFNSMGDLIAINIIISLWPGFYWIALSLVLLSKFRTDILITKAILKRLLLNLPVLVMQVFVFASLNILLLLITSVSNLPFLLLPLVSVWNCVFIFLVIVRIENGTSPYVTIGQIARVKLILRK
ncbi:hypothetical protein ACI0X9_003313 [Cronobacter turicensis]